LVDEHIDFVTRTLRRAGVRLGDLDDEVQKTFIIVARRLEDVEVGSERSFLFRVAHHLASHARRKHMRRREVLDDPPEAIEEIATPEFFAERNQLRKLLDDILLRLKEPMRAVFTLFALDGLNLSEISKILAVPRGTVASRLRRARVLLRDYAAAVDLGDDLRPDDATEGAEPTRLRLKRVSALESAILRAGTSAGASATTHAKVLGALGFEQPVSSPSSQRRSSIRTA